MVGLLIDKITVRYTLDDNWIYILGDKVKFGRIEIFNYWSPFLVEDSNKIWIGMEYFCFDAKTDD
jgi:hypothetical protein